MALSGSKKGTVTKNSSHYEYWMSWSATQSIADNTSTITVKHYWKKIGSKTFDSTAARNYGITIDDKAFTGSKRMDYSPWADKNISTATYTVSHNSDGTKSLTISTYANGTAGDHGPSNGTDSSGNCTASVTVTLDQIPRAAQLLSATNFTDETNPTITYSNPAGTAADVQVGIFDTNGQTSYVGYRSVPQTGTSYTFSLTTAEKKALIEAVPDGKKEMYVRIYFKTYINGELVGSLTHLQRIFTVVNTTPTLSYSASDTGTVSTDLTNDPNVMIKGYNVVVASMTPSLKKYASIKSQTITNGSKTVSGTSATFSYTENNVFKFSITDSFGNTINESKTLAMVEYTKLTCNVSTSNPTVNGDVSVKIFGNYFDDKFGSKGDQNTLTLKYRIKENNGSYGDWTTVATSPTIENNAYTVTVPITGLDNQITYTIQAMAIDLMNPNGITSTERSFKTTPVFNWGSDNFDINVPLTIQGNPQGYPIGAIYASADSTDPKNLFGGTWTQIKTYTGGELLGTASVMAKGGDTCTSNTDVAWSDIKVGAKTFYIQNFVGATLYENDGTIRVETQGIVGFVEATICLTGLGGSGIRGIWFQGNANTLPDGVACRGGGFLATAPQNENYGGATNTYHYFAKTANANFTINPSFRPYNGTMNFSVSGTESWLHVKAYARTGTTYVWKRTA